MLDKILVVDNEPDTLNLIKVILENEGYCVVCATNGKEAIKKVENEVPNLILLDVIMPHMNGYDVCKNLKSRPKTKSIPIVMFTVLDREADRKRSEECGCDGFVSKPFTSKVLLENVKRYLKKPCHN